MGDKIPGLCEKHGFTDRITGTPARVHTQLVCPFCRIEQLEGLLAEETAAREAAEESVCKLGGGPRTMSAERAEVIKEAGRDIVVLAGMVLKLRYKLIEVQNAVDHANNRWSEWGERAITVAEKLDAALDDLSPFFKDETVEDFVKHLREVEEKFVSDVDHVTIDLAKFPWDRIVKRFREKRAESRT